MTIMTTDKAHTHMANTFKRATGTGSNAQEPIFDPQFCNCVEECDEELESHKTSSTIFQPILHISSLTIYIVSSFLPGPWRCVYDPPPDVEGVVAVVGHQVAVLQVEP